MGKSSTDSGDREYENFGVSGGRQLIPAFERGRNERRRRRAEGADLALRVDQVDLALQHHQLLKHAAALAEPARGGAGLPMQIELVDGEERPELRLVDQAK